MVNEENNNTKVEEAKVYVDLSKEKIDSIWKRRQFTWKTNFVLWGALGAVSAALYKEGIELPFYLLPCTLFVFFVIFGSHSCHWIGAYVSDEIGFSWAHYYQEQAEVCLNPNISNLKHRPLSTEGWCYYLFKKPNKKKIFHAIIPQILITVVLMGVVLILLHGKINKKTESEESSKCKLTYVEYINKVNINEPSETLLQFKQNKNQ